MICSVTVLRSTLLPRCYVHLVVVRCYDLLLLPLIVALVVTVVVDLLLLLPLFCRLFVTLPVTVDYSICC